MKLILWVGFLQAKYEAINEIFEQSRYVSLRKTGHGQAMRKNSLLILNIVTTEYQPLSLFDLLKA